MRTLPILFNTDMVRALLEERKTVTRRVIKYSASDIYKSACFHGRWNEGMDADSFHRSLIDWYCKEVKRPPYEPGDILYVRETWVKVFALGEPYFIFKADDLDGDMERQKIWKPSIHMPKEAARIFLRVTEVRAERLEDITEEQARAEGFGSRAEFLKAFLTMYPDCTEKSWVWVIKFERVDKPEGW